MKIRTQSAIVILCAIIAAFAFFELLWLNKWKFCEAAEDLDLFYTQISDDRFKETLAKEALNYNIPESEDDEEAVSHSLILPTNIPPSISTAKKTACTAQASSHPLWIPEASSSFSISATSLPAARENM